MKKSHAEPTTAKNLEDKFDRGEEVLDYFDAGKARIVRPRSQAAGKVKSAGAYSGKSESAQRTVIREEPASPKKKSSRKLNRPD